MLAHKNCNSVVFLSIDKEAGGSTDKKGMRACIKKKSLTGMSIACADSPFFIGIYF